MGVSRLNRMYRQQIREGNYPTCYLCKQPITKESEVSQDHLLPKSLGGTSSPKNLVVAHKFCNSKRGVTPLSMIACGIWRSGFYFKQKE